MMVLPLMNKVWAKINFWRELSRQRDQLMMMDDHLLKDIGLSRTEAEHEAKRHFWDSSPVQTGSPWQPRKSTACIETGERECSMHA
jgi:uncharacterized protein YjiS (DUF1127 family)